MGYIDRAKNELDLGNQLETDSFFETAAAQVYATYQQKLLASNAMDFGDLINQVLVLFENTPWSSRSTNGCGRPFWWTSSRTQTGCNTNC